MDSSNSGSFQSSSGGGGGDNDDYDSTTHQSAAISSFFNPPPPPPTNFNSNLNHHLLQQPPPPSSAYHHHPFYSNNHPLQDPAWTTRSSMNNNILPPDLGTYSSSSSSTMINHNMDHLSQPKPAAPHRGSDHQIGVSSLKNPKKRTRASRRAPTTVLTTDTTNFRQMVQEFTGIPTAPFSRRPLDLTRPPPFLNSTANTPSSSSSTMIPKQPSSTNFLDHLQNPMFSFQSLLQNSDLPHQSITNSSKPRWTHGKLEGVIIGGSKLNSGIENHVLTAGTATATAADQVQGNTTHEASWICPSN